MECRPGCGACCIVISISSPIIGMPDGKPAGVRCIHLSEDHLCKIFNHPKRPQVCCDFKAGIDMCGNSTEEAIENLRVLEEETKP